MGILLIIFMVLAFILFMGGVIILIFKTLDRIYATACGDAKRERKITYVIVTSLTIVATVLLVLFANYTG